MTTYPYAFAVGTLIYGVIWLAFYASKPNLRRQMLLLSLLVGAFGLAEPLFYGKYWSPEYLITIPNLHIGLEDLLIMFFQGGIAAVVYELFYAISWRQAPGTKPSLRLPRLFILAVPLLAILAGGMWLTQMNIVYIFMIAILMTGVFVLLRRPDFLANAIISGIIFGILSFAITLIFQLLFPGVIAAWWNLPALSGVLVIGIPIEEILWHVVIGFTVGPVYEYWQELVAQKQKRTTTKTKVVKTGAKRKAGK